MNNVPRRQKPQAKCQNCIDVSHVFPDGLCFVCHHRRLQLDSLKRKQDKKLKNLPFVTPLEFKRSFDIKKFLEEHATSKLK
jgi:hypothetical protein